MKDFRVTVGVIFLITHKLKLNSHKSLRNPVGLSGPDQTGGTNHCTAEVHPRGVDAHCRMGGISGGESPTSALNSEALR